MYTVKKNNLQLLIKKKKTMWKDYTSTRVLRVVKESQMMNSEFQDLQLSQASIWKQKE